MFIGAHVSASGGFEKAAERAGELGANALQLFTGSPRVWRSKTVDDIDFDAWFEAREKFGIKKAVIHATYLVNLASDKEALLEKSRKALIDDMKVCAKGKFDGVVVHLGSHQGRGFEAVKEQVAGEIKHIIKEAGGGMFLIENSAGQKGKVASELAEIRWLLDKVDSKNLGWCFDTCHAHANGYLLGKNQNPNIKKQNDKKKTKNDQVDMFGEDGVASGAVSEMTKLKLWGSLKCVHVNDSRDPFASGRDRHDNLGEGMIAKGDIKEFLNNSHIQSLPLILEVPGLDGKGPDKANMERLRKIVESS